MFDKVFLDANILIDIAGVKRPMHQQSLALLRWLIQHKVTLFTSCDIITTIYYINAKEDREQALRNIMNINTLCSVIEFSNDEIDQTCQLMLQEPEYKDLEDTIQYVLALKEGCELIVSNDKAFFSKEIPVLSSTEFLGKYL